MSHFITFGNTSIVADQVLGVIDRSTSYMNGYKAACEVVMRGGERIYLNEVSKAEVMEAVAKAKEDIDVDAKKT